MAYLPELGPEMPRLNLGGPLAGWLRQGLIEREVDGIERLMLRFDYLYAVRRATRRSFEPTPDLVKETAWLIEALRAELPWHDWSVVAGSVRRALKLWESDGEA